MTPATNPLAIAYATSRLALRRAVARGASPTALNRARNAAHAAWVAACRGGERDAAIKVRNAIDADHSLADLSGILSAIRSA